MGAAVSAPFPSVRPKEGTVADQTWERRLRHALPRMTFGCNLVPFRQLHRALLQHASDDPIYQALVQLERSFDLGRGFLVGLWFNESDWSFVIKAHALLEAATTQLLANHLGAPGLTDTLACLPQSDPRSGRLAFLRALELLDEGELRFIQKFSELRNKLAHNVHNTRFTFVDHLATLPHPEEQFAEWVAFAGKDPAALSRRRHYALSAPKTELWLSVMYILARCEQRKIDAQDRQRQIAAALKLLAESTEGSDDEED